MIDLEQRPRQRAATRISTTLTGSLIVPAEDDILDCVVVNLSATGAGVICAEPPPTHTYVVLRVDGLGDVEGVTAWFGGGQLGIEFLASLDNCAEFADRLSRWLFTATPGTHHEGELPCAIAPHSRLEVSEHNPAQSASGSIEMLGRTTGQSALVQSDRTMARVEP